MVMGNDDRCRAEDVDGAHTIMLNVRVSKSGDVRAAGQQSESDKCGGNLGAHGLLQSLDV